MQYEICDTSALGSLCDTAWVFITINPVNDPPVADDEAETTPEDTPVLIAVTFGDTDLDGKIDSTTVALVDTTSNGGINIDPITGDITYTPNPNFFGLDTLTYRVCDDGSPVLCDTAQVIITVLPVNDPPIADNDTTSTNEDVAVSLNALLDDYDIDGSLIGDSIRILTLPENGTVVDNGDSTLTYDPVANFFGIDSIQYEICDTSSLGSLCDTAWIFITVNPVNDPPIADNDTTTTNEDTAVNLNALLDDYDIDGSLIGDSIRILTLPLNGTVVDNGDSTLTYDPVANFFGIDSIQYEICDTSSLGSLCDTAWVFITINPVNDPPIADNDTTSTNEDVAVSLNALLDDYDIDGNLHGDSIRILTLPENGTVADNGDSTLTYDPVANFFGIDSIQYEICDTSSLGSLCDTAWVFITINPVNDPPVADDETETTPEDTPVLIAVTFGDTDLDGKIDSTTVALVDTTSNGGINIDSITGDITYTPNPNFFGMDTLTYRVCDDGSPVLCDTAQVIITVLPVNDPPIADNDTTTTLEDTAVNLNALLDDYDIDGSLIGDSIRILTLPENGTVADNGDSTLTYDPVANFFGIDSIQYEICDTSSLGNLCDTAWVFITINPVNDPPVADNDTTTTNEDTAVSLNALLDDYDIDGNLHGDSIRILTLPENGTVADNGDSTLTYDPVANFFGVDSIQYEICDTSSLGSLCDTAWVFITINPVNDPPVADDEAETTPEDTPVLIAVTFGDTDLDGKIDSTTVALVDTTSNGGITIDPITGDITYTPNPNFFGMDTLTYRVCDDGSPVLCDTAQVIITVLPVNDPPIADNDTTSTNEDVAVSLNALLDDYDIDGSLIGDSIRILTLPENGTVADNGDSTLTYDPVANFFGIDSIQYEICDTSSLGSLCDTAWVFITINPVNDPPVADNDTTTTNEDTPVTLYILLDDYDIDGDLHGDSIRIITLPTAGIVVDNMDSTLTYRPNLNTNGLDSLQYEICDSGSPSLCDTAWVFIDIIPINDSPTLGNEKTIVEEDVPSQTPNVFYNNTDLDGDNLMIMTLPTMSTQGGIVSYNPIDSTFTYTSPMDFNGLDTILYTVCDDGSPIECVLDSVFITVNPVNDPPVADNDTTTTLEDLPVDLNILLDDYDVDGDLVGDSINILILPVNGTVIDNGDSTFTYTPTMDFFGIDSLQYEICDTSSLGSLCDTAWVFITIQQVNNPPIPGNEIVYTPQDSTIKDIDLLANNSDPDGDLITLNPPATSNQGGIVTNNGDGTIDYTPPVGFSGLDSVIYMVCDPFAVCVTDTLFITVGGCITINTAVYLEGSWDGAEMYTKLNDFGYLPGQKPSTFFGTYTTAGQPYGVAPWFYNGTEGLTKDYTVSGIPDAGYDADVVDWVLVSLRTGTSDATTVCQKAGLLHKDGSITFESGFDCCDINPFQQYYLVVEHRNHLLVMSHQPVGVTNDTITYDFRVQQSYTNLFGFGQLKIRDGVYVMFGGNGEQIVTNSADTDINVADKDTWIDENGNHSSYYFQDFDMNGDTNVQDKNLWVRNNGKFSDVPRN